jgi:hypothetical protein
MTLQEQVTQGRATGDINHHRAPVPPTLLQQRRESLTRAAKERDAARPRIFTAEFVKAQGPAAIARLLDDCWYDLVTAERR